MAPTIIDRISEKIFGSPLAITIERELADETFATRQTQAEELAALEAQLFEKVAARARERAAAADAIADREAATAAARARAGDLERTYRREMDPLEDRRDRLLYLLRCSASPQLDACVAELRAQLANSNALRDTVSERTVDGGSRVAWSNHGTVDAYVAAIYRLIGELRDDGPLRLEALDEATVTARLTALRASLPSVETRPAKYQGHPA